VLPPWQQAWQQALYGPVGFYRRAEGPAGHFRTAAHAAPDELSLALRALANDLGCPAIVDVGAGRGELLTALAGNSRSSGAKPLWLWGVDIVPRPPQLPDTVAWAQGLAELPDEALMGALVIGWELLDVVPCPILELDAAGLPRVMLVEPETGRERPGDLANGPDLEWCQRWWPLAGRQEGDRIEVGAPRDEFWAALVRRAVGADAGALLAVDYAHRKDDRPSQGSLTGFRAGRAVPPRPDGSMDLTAHVAIDAVAAAGLAAGATPVQQVSQREALKSLGVTNRELLDPGGLGGFGWLLQLAE
jgi:hypothetical protein